MMLQVWATELLRSEQSTGAFRNRLAGTEHGNVSSSLTGGGQVRQVGAALFCCGTPRWSREQWNGQSPFERHNAHSTTSAPPWGVFTHRRRGTAGVLVPPFPHNGTAVGPSAELRSPLRITPGVGAAGFNFRLVAPPEGLASAVPHTGAVRCA